MSSTMQVRLSLLLALVVVATQFVLNFLQQQSNVDGLGITSQTVTWAMMVGGLIVSCVAFIQTQLASKQQATVIEQQQGEIEAHKHTIAEIATAKVEVAKAEEENR